jgi:hypothetical protein
MNERPLVRQSAKQVASQRQTDWSLFDSLSDEDIERAIAEDPDAAPVMDEAWTRREFNVRLVTDQEDKAR